MIELCDSAVENKSIHITTLCITVFLISNQVKVELNDLKKNYV